MRETTGPGGLPAPEDVDGPTLAEYIAGECTPVRSAAVAAWIAASPERRAQVAALRAVWDGSAIPAAEASADPTAAWEQLKKRLNARVERATLNQQVGLVGRRASISRFPRDWPGGVGVPVTTGSSSWTVPSWTGRVTARAAAVIVLLATGSVATWRLARVTAVQPLREFVSAPGSRATITLHDGTGLQLAPASRLRVPADFGRGTRMVELEGQAYFAVVHDAAHPFVVRTARAEVRDVGTTFTVRAYADDPTERVAVADGEVALGAVSLRAHDAATVDSAGRVAIHHGVNLTSDFAWTQGRFVFNDTPLRDVARELSRAFNVTITVADSTLIGQHITGEFDDDAMDQVLDDVTDAIGARYERFGRTVTIRRRSSRAGWRSPGAPAPMSTVQATAPHE